MQQVPLKRAPAWRMSEWLNTQAPIHLEAQRGRVVVACAFQMLCPGCVAQAIPQLKTVNKHFASDDVLVVGMHTVFEHHEVMTADALKAFLYENQIRFPVGVDQPSPGNGSIPQTMAAYGMRGTSTWLLIDRAGNLRQQTFGHIDDLELGAAITRLMLEDPSVSAVSNG